MPLKKFKMSRLKSIMRFFYYLLRYKLDLKNIFGIENNTNISKKAKLYTPYQINEVKVGDYTYIGDNAIISYTEIGKYCSIGPNFLCGWGIHPLNGISTAPMFYSTMKQNGYTLSKENKIEERKPIVIGNDVFIGANVTILDGVTIGNGAVIGAGAVVSKDIPPYAIAAGCPINILRYRFKQEVIDELEKIQWWENEKNNHLVEKYFFEIDSFIKEIQK